MRVDSHSRLFAVLVPILAGFGALVLVEALLAAFHPIPFSIERNMYFEADPYTGYRLKPNSRGYWGARIPATVNAHGYRDVDTPVEKRPDGYRILVLGDSFTVGADVRQEQAYPKVLERLLNSRAQRPIEVVNTGVGGWDPFQYAQHYEHYGRQFRPDLVLVGFFVGNDAYSQAASVDELPTAVEGRRVTRSAAALGGYTAARVYLTEHFNLGRLLLLKGPGQPDRDRTSCVDFTDDYLAIQRDRLANHLRRDARQMALGENALRQISRIKAIADMDGVPLIVAFLPDENQVNLSLRRILVPADQQDKYDFTMPQSMLRETFGGAGVRTIDLLPTFLADPRCLYMNTTHWTPDGHALAASAIADQIGSGPWSAAER